MKSTVLYINLEMDLGKFIIFLLALIATGMLGFLVNDANLVQCTPNFTNITFSNISGAFEAELSTASVRLGYLSVTLHTAHLDIGLLYSNVGPFFSKFNVTASEFLLIKSAAETFSSATSYTYPALGVLWTAIFLTLAIMVVVFTYHGKYNWWARFVPAVGSGGMITTMFGLILSLGDTIGPQLNNIALFSMRQTTVYMDCDVAANTYVAVGALVSICMIIVCLCHELVKNQSTYVAVHSEVT